LINSDRQIVQPNSKLVTFSGHSAADLIGRRLGEAVGCEYSSDAPAGCGTTPACALCGAAEAIAQTLDTGKAAQAECRITINTAHGHEPMELRVWTTPVRMDGEDFMVFAVRDISDEHRRRVLERMFFHDVLNSAGGLRNLLEILPDLSPEEAEGMRTSASHLAAQVVEEIQSQRDLAAAERGELSPHVHPMDVPAMLHELVALYQHHSVAEGKTLVAEVNDGSKPFSSDPVLLRRVLGNLVKNALEASTPGQRVTIRYRNTGTPIFSVHNESVMPAAVKLQVFQRSFTTKAGIGRGVGTYSARLLTERYLRGRISFESRDGEGTTFTVVL
jgi:signal transduction histidine kinase